MREFNAVISVVCLRPWFHLSPRQLLLHIFLSLPIKQTQFSSPRSSVEVGANLDSLQLVSIINDIEDINETQTFIVRDSRYVAGQMRVKTNENSHLDYKDDCYRFLRLTFPSSSDFYGRVTIYNLEVYGYERVMSPVL